MGKRSAADRRKRANGGNSGNSGAYAQQRTSSPRQTPPPMPAAPYTGDGASEASSPTAASGSTSGIHTFASYEMSESSASRIPIPTGVASASQPLPYEHGAHSGHAVTLADPVDDDEGPSSDESVARRIYFTGAGWRRPLSVRERASDLANRVMPFSLRERDWGSTAQVRGRLISIGAVAAALVLALVAGMVVFHLAQNAGKVVGNLPAPQATAAAPRGIVVQTGSGSTAPTPAFAPYLIGAWVSNTAPAPSSAVQVFVRVSTSTGPAANVPVTIHVQYPGNSNTFGPSRTDSYGLATFAVPTGTGDGKHVVFVTAQTQVNGKTYTTETTFTPYLGGSGTGTSTGG